MKLGKNDRELIAQSEGILKAIGTKLKANDVRTEKVDLAKIALELADRREESLKNGVEN